MEQVLAQLEAIVHFTEELRARLGTGGAHGVEGVLALYGRMKSALDTIPATEIDRIAAEVEALGRVVDEMRHDLSSLKRLKELLVV